MINHQEIYEFINEEKLTTDVSTFQLKAKDIMELKTGDVKYVMCISGSRNAACECPQCEGVKSDWLLQPSDKPLLTTETLSRIAPRPELLPAIPPNDGILEPLHLKINLTNNLLEYLFTFIEDHLEIENEEISRVRISLNSVLKDLEYSKERKPALAGIIKELKAKLKEFKKLKKRLNTINNYKTITKQNNSKKERNLIQRQLSNIDGEVMSTQLREYEAEQEVLHNTIMYLENEKTVLRSTIADSVTSNPHPLKIKVLKILNEEGISREQYHNNTLNGEHCEKLLMNEAIILRKIHEVLKLAEFRRSYLVEDIDQKLEQFMRRPSQLMNMFNFICYHLCRTEEIKEDELIQLETVLKHFGICWRTFFNYTHVTPSFHILESHSIDNLKKFKSTGRFSSETMEKYHHICQELLRLYDHITSWKQREIAIQQRFSLMNDKEAHDKIEDVISRRKRKFSPVIEEKRQQKQQKKEEDKQFNLNSTLQRITESF